MPTVKATFTADISQFRQSLAQATTAVTAFDRTTAQVNTSLKRFGNEFSGAKLQREAEEMATAIKSIGGAAVLTDSNLKRANTTIKEAIQQYERLGTAAPASIRSLNSELDTLLAKSKQIDAVTPEKATKGFSLMQGAVAGVAAAISSQALSSIKQFASDIVETASDVADLAAKTGLTTGQVQRFGYAAQQTGSSVEAITGAVTQLSNRLVEGGTGTVSAVERLGLSFADLQRMDPGAAFEEIARAIRAVPDPMQQTQLAMELFGRSGAEILPAIKQGISELGTEAERLGLVIDGSAIKALDDFGDSWDRMALRAKASAAGVFADTMRIIDALTDVGRFAASAIPKDSPAGTAARVAGSIVSSPFSLGAAGLYGTASRFTNQYLLPTTERDLPAAPNARPMPIASPFAPITAAQVAEAERQVTAMERTHSHASAIIKKTYLDLTNGQRVAMRSLKDAGVGWEEYAGSVQLAEMELAAFIDTQRIANQGTIASKQFSSSSLMMTGPYQYQVSDNMTAGVLDGTKRVALATKNWRAELQGVSQAFANLAQVGGRSLDGLNRTIGTAFASANAGMEMVEALSGIFDGLKNDKGELTGSGKALAGGMAGLGIGTQIGSVTTSKWKAFLGGAAGGAVTGGMAGGPWGAAVGAIIGGASAVITSGALSHAQNKAKDIQLDQLVAQFGTLDELLHVADGLGLDQEGLLKKLWGDPEAFAKGVSELNAALTRERAEADKLAKSLNDVARVQGVLSQQKLAELGSVRKDGPAAEAVESFLKGQTAQAEQGILSSIAALDAYGERALVDFKGAAEGAAAGLAALFGEALATGESAVSILSRLGGGFATLQRLFDTQGKTPNPAFARISDLAGIASGPQTGPAVQTGAGLGQALAGFANTGVFAAMPELFGDIANGIGSAWRALELFGAGGQRGAALFQPYLQTLDELIRDNPVLEEQLDDQTRALLEYARANGIVGAAFESDAKKQATAIDLLIEKIGALIDRIGNVPGINIPVTYTPTNEPGSDGATLPTSPFPGGRPTLPDVPSDAGTSSIDLGTLRTSAGRGPITVVSPVIVDGREVARAVNRYQGDERRLVGAA